MYVGSAIRCQWCGAVGIPCRLWQRAALLSTASPSEGLVVTKNKYNRLYKRESAVILRVVCSQI